MGLLDGTTQSAYFNGDDFGNYQFTSLKDIINQFMAVYVGEDKIITKVKRVDVAFHAQRAMQELSFDVFKSCKAQEIVVPPSLQMTLPQDYVNYTKVSWVDSAGIKHLLYPTSKTSNPSKGYPTTNTNYTVDNFKRTLTGVVSNTGAAVIIYGELIYDIGVGDNIYAPGISDTEVLNINHDVINNNTYMYFGVPGAAYVDIPVHSEALNPGFGYQIGDNIDFEVTGKVGTTHIFDRKAEGVAVDLDYTLGSSIAIAAAGTDMSSLKVGMRLMGATNMYVMTVPTVYIVGISNDQVYLSEPADFGSTSIPSIFHESGTDYDSATWASYKSATPPENQDDYQDDIYWPMDGSRYGLDPQHAQANGTFYIDCVSGKIHFSSNISGKTVILDYISDSLGTDGEMQVHKFAEEAMYKWLSHAILSGRANVPEYQVNRFKKERSAAIRNAKLRLSNIKLEEITQILRGKSKQIKH